MSKTRLTFKISHPDIDEFWAALNDEEKRSFTEHAVVFYSMTGGKSWLEKLLGRPVFDGVTFDRRLTDRTDREIKSEVPLKKRADVVPKAIISPDLMLETFGGATKPVSS